MKVTITIESLEWTEQEAKNFLDWLESEMTDNPFNEFGELTFEGKIEEGS